MEPVRWFERKFDFGYEQNILPSLIERLDGTPLRLEAKVGGLPEVQLTARLNDRWSIQENVGHLIDLEPLWQGRLEDILAGVEVMRPADLDNTLTHRARHNDRNITDLLATFRQLRQQTVTRMQQLSNEEIYRTALHPRLEKPMRMMDLFLFTAEHDDHHLARISELKRSLQSRQQG